MLLSHYIASVCGRRLTKGVPLVLDNAWRLAVTMTSCYDCLPRAIVYSSADCLDSSHTSAW